MVSLPKKHRIIISQTETSDQLPVTPVKYDMVTQQQQQQLNKQLLDVVTVGQYLYLSLQR